MPSPASVVRRVLAVRGRPARASALLVACLLVGAVFGLRPAIAQAQAIEADLVISSGHEQGNYYAIARRLRSRLLAEHGLYAEPMTSPGSLENLRRLAEPSDPTGLALTQADALAVFLEEHPDFAGGYAVLADVGEECLLLIAGKDGAKTAADFRQKGDRTLAVGPPGGGAAVTWQHLGMIDPEYRNTAPSPIGAAEALFAIASGDARSKLAGALLVQQPRRITPALQAVIDDQDAYRLVPLRAGDVSVRTLPHGDKVYAFSTVSVRQLSVDTVCTRGLLLGSLTKLSEERRGQIAQTLLKNASYIAPQPK